MSKVRHLLTVAAIVAAPALSAQAAGDPESVYTAVIEKISNTYCIKCHTPEKKKGGLILDTYENLIKGGKSQQKSGKKAVDPGKSASSLFFTTTQLPQDDDDHMPPSEKPQPSKDDLAIIKWWIDSGAKNDVKVAASNPPAELKAAIDAWVAKKVEAPAAK